MRLPPSMCQAIPGASLRAAVACEQPLQSLNYKIKSTRLAPSCSWALCRPPSTRIMLEAKFRTNLARRFARKQRDAIHMDLSMSC